MSKLAMGGLLLLVGAIVFVSAPAAAGDNDVEITAEGHVRAEYIDDLDDFDSDIGKSFDFTTYLVRVGLGFEISDNVKAFGEFQADGLWGDAAFSASDLPGTTGQAPFDNDSLLMYQAYIDLMNVGGSPVSLRIGRQEHVLGNELHLGDNDFYNGQFFDGIRAMIDLNSVDLEVFYYEIEERDLTSAGGGTPGDNDTTLIGVTANFEVGEGHVIEPYVLQFRDASPMGMADFDLLTVGALYDRSGEDSAFDWSLEVAIQTGDINDGGFCPGLTPCDASSTIAEGSFGYSFAENHRVHIGALMLGGDDDPDDFEFFLPIATDTHRRAGAMDFFSVFDTTLVNLTNYYVGYGWTGGAHSFSGTYHDFAATEDFGLEDEIAQEVDLIYNYAHGERVGIEIGVASFMPGDAFPSGADDPIRVWAMVRLTK